MSTRKNFPRTASRFAARVLAAATVVTLALAPASVVPGLDSVARADELVLSGPHPALKENALNLQFLFGAGLSDSWSGRGLGIGYGYMLHGPLWLDLQMNLRASACGPFRDCGAHTGNDAELMAGVAWRFRTDIPVVPILRGGIGLIYLYPNGAQSAIGLAARAGAGIKYYLYDWLGFGVEAALSLGHGYLGQDYAGGRTYAVADMGVGVEYQFQ